MQLDTVCGWEGNNNCKMSGEWNFFCRGDRSRNMETDHTRSNLTSDTFGWREGRKITALISKTIPVSLRNLNIWIPSLANVAPVCNVAKKKHTLERVFPNPETLCKWQSKAKRGFSEPGRHDFIHRRAKLKCATHRAKVTSQWRGSARLEIFAYVLRSVRDEKISLIEWGNFLSLNALQEGQHRLHHFTKC